MTEYIDRLTELEAKALMTLEEISSNRNALPADRVAAAIGILQYVSECRRLEVPEESVN